MRSFPSCIQKCPRSRNNRAKACSLCRKYFLYVDESRIREELDANSLIVERTVQNKNMGQAEALNLLSPKPNFTITSINTDTLTDGISTAILTQYLVNIHNEEGKYPFNIVVDQQFAGT